MTLQTLSDKLAICQVLSMQFLGERDNFLSHIISKKGIYIYIYVDPTKIQNEWPTPKIGID